MVHTEAVAQGLPVVAFDVCANAESVVVLGSDGGGGQDGSSKGAGAGAGGAGDSVRSVGVRSALLPYREGAVVQDLALALLTAFLQHRRHQQWHQDNQLAEQAPDQGEAREAREAAQSEGGGGKRHALCDAVVPIFAQWNNRQHSRALVDALTMFLPSFSELKRS